MLDTFSLIEDRVINCAENLRRVAIHTGRVNNTSFTPRTRRTVRPRLVRPLP